MWLWIILVLVALFCYFWAGLCVFVTGNSSDGGRTEMGVKVMMLGLCMIFWPFAPIIALLNKD
jgi:hypothetical protein